jgi:triphosphoribosyl-dephospho-CoA synthase
LRRDEAGNLVAGCATLAALLEVSAYPKPGNVHRTRDLPGTRYEHFLAGSVAIEPAMRSLAVRGFDVKRKSMRWSDVEVGHHILEAAKESLNWQKGGNVNFGIILLMAPIAAAGGSILVSDERISARRLAKELRNVIHSTTPDDALAVYDAIRLSVPARVLGQVKELDVLNDSTSTRIQEERLTLLDIFEKCASRDSICREWVSCFQMTFNTGYPYLKDALENSGDVNAAVVNTFLFILSQHPDSLIQRKNDIDKASEVSEMAWRVLNEGGASSAQGKELLKSMDEELNREGGKLNPGTTADLTAASIFVVLLEGWRP